VINKTGETEAIFPILPGMNFIEEAFLASSYPALVIHFLTLLYIMINSATHYDYKPTTDYCFKGTTLGYSILNTKASERLHLLRVH